MKPLLYLSCLVFSWLALAPNARAQGLQIRPEEVDLGTVKVGAEKRLEIAVKNTDTDEVEVLASASGGHFAVEPASLKLPGGGESIVQVVFAAEAVGEYQGELLLQIKSFLKTEKYPVPLRAAAAVLPMYRYSGGSMGSPSISTKKLCP